MIPILSRQGREVEITSLKDPKISFELIKAIKSCQQDGYHDIVINCAASAIYPNVAAPIAGLLEHFRVREGLTFYYVGLTANLINSIGLSAPSDIDCSCEKKPLNRVWRFHDRHQIRAFTNGIILAVASHAECKSGVLNALGFCINEVLDNVQLHSEADCGYVMAQIHPTAKHIALCIYDTGQGIFNSLQEKLAPKTPVEAIEISMKNGVTDGKGQGFGLWGLRNIIEVNSGRLSIASGSGLCVLSHGNLKRFDALPFLSEANNCTSVDFQIDFDKPIEVSTALGEFEPVAFFETTDVDHFGNITFAVSNPQFGTGTRLDGEVARNIAFNMSLESENFVVIDFEGVELISASFADEFVAKLAEIFTIEEFKKRFTIQNMAPFVKNIVDRAIQRRLSGKPTSGEELP